VLIGKSQLFYKDIGKFLLIFFIFAFFYRCRNSVEFSVKCVWLLSAFSADVLKPTWKTSQGLKLRNMILSEELRFVTAVLRSYVDIWNLFVCLFYNNFNTFFLVSPANRLSWIINLQVITNFPVTEQLTISHDILISGEGWIDHFTCHQR
jgi:hypothetical protein